jgi:hypothetical protein
MKPLLTALFLLTLISCQGTKRPGLSAAEGEFARVYARLVMASSDQNVASGTTPEQILKDAGMTQEEFRKTVAEYNRDPQRWGTLIEKVQKIVEEEVARRMSTQPGAGQPASGSAGTPSAAANRASKPGDAASKPVDAASRPAEPAAQRSSAASGQGFRQPSR